jgi:tetratricopeptide (TPR) repeat protein
VSRPLPFNLQVALSERELAFADLETFEQALVDARQELDREPTAERQYRYAILLAAQGQYEEALLYLDRAIAAKPNYVEAIAERGLVYGCLERFDRAMVDLKTAIITRPAYHRAWANRAILHAQRGMWNDVISDASQAIELAPRDALAYKIRAIGHQANRQTDAAIADLRMFLSLAPTAPDRTKLEAALQALEGRQAEPDIWGWLSKLLRRR